MNAKRKITSKGNVIAISQEAEKLRAVELAKQRGEIRILRTKSSEQEDFGYLAQEFGVSSFPTTVAKDGDTIVVGYDCSAMVFYRIEVPAGKDEEIAAMVRLQAESRLPLSAEQMEVAWRAGKVVAGQVPVTVAAGRREALERFIDSLGGFKPAKIVLDCEAIVNVFKEFFCVKDEHFGTSVIVSIESRKTKVCLAESGELVNAACLDVGMEDFSSTEPAERSAEAIMERFSQDLYSVLELFGYTEPKEIPIVVLSDGGGLMEEIVSSLDRGGLDAYAGLVDAEKLKANSDVSDADVYEYRVAIGLGLTAIEPYGDELNIFERLYSSAGTKEKKHWKYSLKITGTIAAAMLVLLVIIFYLVDVVSLKRIESQLAQMESQAKCNLLTRQKLIKTIAQERPDLLKLLSEINSGDNNGITLDGFNYKKGRTISIEGQADGDDQLYKFEKTLQDKKGITKVKIQSAPKDKKSKKIKFTITFHYRNFTKKKGRV